MTYHTKAFTGPNAAVAKYDVISALTCIALSGNRSNQTIILRLINLITTRYNWRNNELSIGSKEAGELTFTSQRTAKRTLKALTELQYLTVRFQGRKGRVTKYGLGTGIIFQDASKLAKPKVHHFAERIGTNPLGEAQVKVATDIKFDNQKCPKWNAICRNLANESQPTYLSWFADTVGVVEGGVLSLQCKTAFIENYIRTNLVAVVLLSAKNSGINLDRVILNSSH